jgi:hypothetical protein
LHWKLAYVAREADHKPRGYLYDAEAATRAATDTIPVREARDLEAVASTPADDDYDREERAAFLEFDAGLCREEAERRAGASSVAAREVDLSGVPF